jgi:hypothetical protein
MGNTRIMRLDEYNEELQEEACKLRESIPQMRTELYRDPEGCFGGRGNNIGHNMVEDAEDRLSWLINQGYTIRTKPYIEMLRASIDLSKIEKIVTHGRKNGNLFIVSANYENTWVYDRQTNAWKSEPTPEILAIAEAVANYHGSTLMEWSGEFYAPRVYI